MLPRGFQRRPEFFWLPPRPFCRNLLWWSFFPWSEGQGPATNCCRRPFLMQSSISFMRSLHSSIRWPWSPWKSHHRDLSRLCAGACSGGGGRSMSLLKLKTSILLFVRGVRWDSSTLGSKRPLFNLSKALFSFSLCSCSFAALWWLPSCSVFLRALSSAAMYLLHGNPHVVGCPRRVADQFIIQGTDLEPVVEDRLYELV